MCIRDRLHLNGALSYSPSINYDYGSTPSIAGRLGFSFPLGRIAKTSKVSTSEIAEYHSETNFNFLKLRNDVKLREEQIDALKAKLDAMINGAGNNQQQAVGSVGSEATTQLIAMLKEQIKTLEEQEQKQNKLIAIQQGEISELQGEISELRDANRSLRKNMAAIMYKLGIKQ